jgi:hypothetical protein
MTGVEVPAAGGARGWLPGTQVSPLGLAGRASFAGAVLSFLALAIVIHFALQGCLITTLLTPSYTHWCPEPHLSIVPFPSIAFPTFSLV